MALIVDTGFSNTKYIGKNKKGILKTVYRETSIKSEGVEFNGERYLLGEDALLKSNSYYLRDLNEMVEFMPLFVCYAASEVGVKQNNMLVVGLPYEFYKDEYAKLETKQSNALSILTERLKKNTFDKKDYIFNDVLILPQGLGAIKLFLDQHNKPTDNILSLDIGFNTIIVTLYSTEKNKILYGKNFYKRGVHDMAENLVKPVLTKKYPGKSFSPVELSYLIEHKYIPMGFDRIDFSMEIKDAGNSYIKRTLNLIVGDLKENFGMIAFSDIVISGGGAHLISDEIESDKVDIHILKEPEYANVKGFSIRLEELQSKESPKTNKNGKQTGKDDK